jgi:hypothetical protein
VEVQTILAKQARENRATLEKLVNDGLAKLNVQLKARGLKPIEARPATTATTEGAEVQPQRPQGITERAQRKTGAWAVATR